MHRVNSRFVLQQMTNKQKIVTGKGVFIIYNYIVLSEREVAFMVVVSNS